MRKGFLHLFFSHTDFFPLKYRLSLSFIMTLCWAGVAGLRKQHHWPLVIKLSVFGFVIIVSRNRSLLSLHCQACHTYWFYQFIQSFPSKLGKMPSPKMQKGFLYIFFIHMDCFPQKQILLVIYTVSVGHLYIFCVNHLCRFCVWSQWEVCIVRCHNLRFPFIYVKIVILADCTHYSHIFLKFEF